MESDSDIDFDLDAESGHDGAGSADGKTRSPAWRSGRANRQSTGSTGTGRTLFDAVGDRGLDTSSDVSADASADHHDGSFERGDKTAAVSTPVTEHTAPASGLPPRRRV